MKTREVKRPAATLFPSAHPSTSAGPLEAGPDGLASVEPVESPDAELNRKHKQRQLSVIYALVAALVLATGDTFQAMFWTAFALSFALEGETRRRVPKLVRFAAYILPTALIIYKVVTLVFKFGGH